MKRLILLASVAATFIGCETVPMQQSTGPKFGASTDDVNVITNIDGSVITKLSKLPIKTSYVVTQGPTTVTENILTDIQKSQGVTFNHDGYDENGSVQIGKDAKAGLSQQIVDGKHSVSTNRNASVAIGMRATATNHNDNASQSIAIGFCAYANGSNAIAIGAGNKHYNSETDDTGHNAVAKGSTVVSIGYNTKALADGALAIGGGTSGAKVTGKNGVSIGKGANVTAEGAYQLGEGTNTEKDSLKFRDVTIVKDGELQGKFEPEDLDPISMIVTDDESDGGTVDPVEEIRIFDVQPHIINTINVSSNSTFSPEIGLKSTGSRNFDVYIDNTPEMRERLPVGFQASTNCTFIQKAGYATEYKVPLMIKIREPVKNKIILDIQYVDDGYEWNPTITNINYTVTTNATNWNLTFGTGGITGTELQLLREFKLRLVYDDPDSFGDTITAEVPLKSSNPLASRIFVDGYSTNNIPKTATLISSGYGFTRENELTW